MSVLKMYFASDNQLVSESGVFTNPIAFTLRADLNESDSVQMYAQCDAGYQATNCTVTISGTSASMWQLASDSAGTPGTYSAGPLSLGTVGPDSGTRVYFWVKALSADTENIGIDTSVTMDLAGIGEAI